MSVMTFAPSPRSLVCSSNSVVEYWSAEVTRYEDQFKKNLAGAALKLYVGVHIGLSALWS